MGRKNGPNFPNNQQRPQITHTQVNTTAWAGPIPPPEHLAKYEEILPGAFDRILKMAEEQAKSRQQLEHFHAETQRTQIDNDHKAVMNAIDHNKRTQLLAFVIYIVTIIGAFTLVALNRDLKSFGILVGTLLTGLGLRIYSQHNNKKESASKPD